MLETIGSASENTQDCKPVNEVFIIDDNEEYRELLAAILELEGFRVVGFPEGTSFLKEASSRVPVCVFLDVMMPGPSGLEVLKALKAKNYAAPIFLISARCNGPAVVEAIKNGAQDFIEKPFDPYAAVLLVREAVEIWDRRGATAPQQDVRLVGLDNGVRLSYTESEVLAYIVTGASTTEIAKALGISNQSVSSHRWRITKKLGAKNSADLVRIVLPKLKPPSGR